MSAPPREVRVSAASGDYRVAIGPGLLRGGGGVLADLVDPGPALLVTDLNVGPLYEPALSKSLREAGFSPTTVTVEPGEGSKDLAHVARLYEALLRIDADRSTPVVTLGGGVISDLAGFAAATFLRGLPWMAAPTTLLAQVDASVGGKTGVNLAAGKNLVGSFHPPRAVLADVSTLRTLDPRQVRSGLAEVLKVALTLDPDLLSRIEARPPEMGDPASESTPATVEACVRAKARVVSADEREGGARRVLNFGHTAGHAIEAAAGYGGVLHGEAVAVGMVAAVRVSIRRGLLDPAWEERVEGLLGALGLPASVGELPVRPERPAVREHLWRDKKIRGRRLTLVLLEEPGRPRIISDATEDELLDAVPGL